MMLVIPEWHCTGHRVLLAVGRSEAEGGTCTESFPAVGLDLSASEVLSAAHPLLCVPAPPSIARRV